MKEKRRYVWRLRPISLLSTDEERTDHLPIVVLKHEGRSGRGQEK